MFSQRKTDAVLGLTFSDDAVRAVIARRTPSGLEEVAQALSAPLPPGALAERGVGDIQAVITALRDLIGRVTVPFRVASVGLPSRTTLARSVTIPNVPPRERRAIVRGEIDHLNLLRRGQEAFDFLILERSDDEITANGGAGAAPATANAGAAPTPPTKADSVFFWAAEEEFVEIWRELVESVGVPVASMEPAEYAAVRIAAGGSDSGGGQDSSASAASRLSLVISCGSHHTYLQFFRDGRPVYARRIDVGASQVREAIEERIAEQHAQEPAIPEEPLPEPLDLREPQDETAAPPTPPALSSLAALFTETAEADEDDAPDAETSDTASTGKGDSGYGVAGRNPIDLLMASMSAPAAPPTPSSMASSDGNGGAAAAVSSAKAGLGSLTAARPTVIALERMLNEIARSLDYFRREFEVGSGSPLDGGDQTDLTISLLTNNTGIDDLATLAGAHLGMPITLVDPAAVQSEDGKPVGTLPLDIVPGPERAAYAPAVGLALGLLRGGGNAGSGRGKSGAAGSAHLLPILDLGQDLAEAARIRRTPRLLIGSFMAAMILLFFGIGGTFLIHEKDLPVRTELDAARHQMDDLDAHERKLQAETSQQMELVRQIRGGHLPWTNVLTNLTAAVPPGVGLTQINVQGQQLSIAGTTAKSDQIATFWQSMNQSPFFAGATVTSIRRQEQEKVISFEMNANLPSDPTGAAGGAKPASTTAAPGAAGTAPGAKRG